MKTANVADLRNHFRRISDWSEEDGSVRIFKRGKPFAVLTRVESEDGGGCAVDGRRQLDGIWGGRMFTAEEVLRMRADELEGEEG